MAICYPHLVNTNYALQKLLHFYKVTWSLKFSYCLQQTHQELCAVQICGSKLNLLWNRIVLSKLYHFHAVFNGNVINTCCYEFQLLPTVQIWWRQSFLKIWFYWQLWPGFDDQNPRLITFLVKTALFLTLLKTLWAKIRKRFHFGHNPFLVLL